MPYTGNNFCLEKVPAKQLWAEVIYPEPYLLKEAAHFEEERDSPFRDGSLNGSSDQLTCLSGKDINWAQLIATAEGMGKMCEKEIELARLDKVAELHQGGGDGGDE